MHRPHTPRARIAWCVFAIGWTLLIAYLTLQSNPLAVDAVAKDHWYCVVCGDAGIADVILNLLLFFPLGVALRALDWPLWRAALVMTAFTVGIETTQANLLIGRDGTVGDVLTNSVGGLLGWRALPLLLAIARPTRRMARIGTITTLTLMTAVWCITAVALQPDLTNATPWIGQPLHRWAGLRHYPGRVDSITIDGVHVGNEALDRVPPWRDSVNIHLALTRDSVWTDQQVVSLVRVIDSTWRMQLDVDQVGDDAVVDLRLRGSAWLLHTPKWRFAGAFASAAGQPWDMTWRWHANQIMMTSGPGSSPDIRRLHRNLTIGLGWVFIHPFVNIVGSGAWIWTILWIGVWFGGLGWFAGRLSRDQATAYAVAGLLAFVGISLIGGYIVLPTELGAGLVAFASGMWWSGRTLRENPALMLPPRDTFAR